MGQRLARAKSKIRQAGIPFRVPERADLRARLDGGAGGDLRRLRRRLVRSRRHRGPPPRPRRGSDLARPAGGLAAARRARGARPAGADAPRRGAARRAAQRRRRLRAARRAGPGLVGRRPDRGGRSAAHCARAGWARSTATSWRLRCSPRMRSAAPPAAADWAAIKRLYDALAGDHGVAGGRDQPRHRDRRDRRRRAPASPRSPRWKAMGVFRITSPIGRRARRCSPPPATSTRPMPPMSRRSAWSATRRCAGSCSTAAPRCGARSSLRSFRGGAKHRTRNPNGLAARTASGFRVRAKTRAPE